MGRSARSRALEAVQRVTAGLAVVIVVVAALATPARAWIRYEAVVDGLALRTGPSTSHALIQRVNRGTPLDAVCGVIGQNINGNAVWLLLTGGQYSSDFFTNSDGWGTRLPTGLPACGSSATAVRTWGRTETRNTAPYGQCTWMAKEKFRVATGVFPGIYGNAKDWAASAQAAGWKVVLDAEARSIVVLQPGVHGAHRTFGHVGWVDSVEFRADGRYIHTTEMNAYGRGEVSHRTLKDVVGMSYILAP
jgi:surface antigen